MKEKLGISTIMVLSLLLLILVPLFPGVLGYSSSSINCNVTVYGFVSVQNFDSGNPIATFGQSGLGGSQYSGEGVYMIAGCRATPRFSGVLQSITIYSYSIGLVNVALYSDLGGLPGTLITNGTMQSVAANAWTTFTVTPLNVTAGTYYWLAAENNDTATFGFNPASSGSAIGKINSQNFPNFPSSWGGGETTWSLQMSIYATYSGIDIPDSIIVSTSGGYYTASLPVGTPILGGQSNLNGVNGSSYSAVMNGAISIGISKINITAGYYVQDGTVEISRNDMEIFGSGNSTFIQSKLNAPNGLSGFHVQLDINNTYIHDLKLDGQSYFQDGGGASASNETIDHGRQGINCEGDNTLMERLTISNFTECGIESPRSSGDRLKVGDIIRDSHFLGGCFDADVWEDYWSNDFQIYNNTFVAIPNYIVNGTSMAWAAIQPTFFDTAYNHTGLIANNTIIGAWTGINCWSTTNALPYGLSIINNTLINCTSTGIYMGCNWANLILSNTIIGTKYAFNFANTNNSLAMYNTLSNIQFNSVVENQGSNWNVFLNNTFLSGSISSEGTQTIYLDNDANAHGVVSAFWWAGNSGIMPSTDIVLVDAYQIQGDSRFYVPLLNRQSSSVSLSLNINPSTLGLIDISDYRFSLASNPTVIWSESSWTSIAPLILRGGADILIISS